MIPKKIKVDRYNVYCLNTKETRGIAREIFGRNDYYVEINKKYPRILDIGAHIGISSLYFRKIFPKSVITCYEPIKENVELLRLNLFENHAEDVGVVAKAVTAEGNDLEMFLDKTKDCWYSTASFREGAWDGTQKSNTEIVESIKFADLLGEKIDLVKMDIEGMELDVLRSAKSMLRQVDRFLVEYHPGRDRKIEELIDVFEEKGFRIEMRKNGKPVAWVKAKGLVLLEAWRR